MLGRRSPLKQVIVVAALRLAASFWFFDGGEAREERRDSMDQNWWMWDGWAPDQTLSGGQVAAA